MEEGPDIPPFEAPRDSSAAIVAPRLGLRSGRRSLVFSGIRGSGDHADTAHHIRPRQRVVSFHASTTFSGFHHSQVALLPFGGRRVRTRVCLRRGASPSRILTFHPR